MPKQTYEIAGYDPSLDNYWDRPLKLVASLALSEKDRSRWEKQGAKAIAKWRKKNAKSKSKKTKPRSKSKAF
jgi:hypothetical protein